ncbi:hypothetical protein [Nocardia flavorosea]|uniref:hypothetical protein n=1 Tax=Nocardia flavorosea TaxID=53429 RepID=UPI002459042A|nr:hypothetical protein [Nocardia flavorosea]
MKPIQSGPYFLNNSPLQRLGQTVVARPSAAGPPRQAGWSSSCDVGGVQVSVCDFEGVG